MLLDKKFLHIRGLKVTARRRGGSTGAGDVDRREGVGQHPGVFDVLVGAGGRVEHAHGPRKKASDDVLTDVLITVILLIAMIILEILAAIITGSGTTHVGGDVVVAAKKEGLLIQSSRRLRFVLRCAEPSTIGGSGAVSGLDYIGYCPKPGHCAGLGLYRVSIELRLTLVVWLSDPLGHELSS